MKDMLLYKCLCVWEAELFALQPSLAPIPCAPSCTLFPSVYVRVCVRETAYKTQALQVFLPHKSSLHHKGFRLWFMGCNH